MMDWRNVPITAGMLVSALEECMSNTSMADYSMGGLMDEVASAIEVAAMKKIDPTYEPV